MTLFYCANFNFIDCNWNNNINNLLTVCDDIVCCNFDNGQFGRCYVRLVYKTTVYTQKSLSKKSDVMQHDIA